MKKNIILGFIILSSAIILSGCTVGQNIGGGAKVNIDSQGENVTIKSDDGKTQYSAGGQAKVPDNFPKELIVVDDARIILSSSSEQGSSVAYATDSEQSAIKEKYVSNLTEQGWKKVTEVNMDKAFVINFSKEKMNVMVNIGENNTKEQAGKSFVHVILVVEE